MTIRPVIAMAVSGAFLALAASGAQAQAARYTMTPVEDGALRLDTHTGAVALCGRKDGYWLCEALSEERDELRREIERLTEENAALQAELESARARLAQDKDDEGTGIRLPNDKDVEQMIAFFEGMMRRFQGMIDSLKPKQAPPEQL